MRFDHREEMLREVNRVLGAGQPSMQRIHIAHAEPDFRVFLSVDSEPEQQQVLSIRLHQSPVFGRVTSLGITENE